MMALRRRHMSGPQLQQRWLENSFQVHITWLLEKWGYPQDYVQGWPQHCAEMILWYSVAGSAVMNEQSADTCVAQVRMNQPDLLPTRRRPTWEGALRLAQEVCRQPGLHPARWFTGEGGPLVAGWQRLDDLYNIGPKIASFILRDLSFMRDYQKPPGALVHTPDTERNCHWFAQLADEEQALFIPIDVYVHAAAVQHAASALATQYDPVTIYSDPTGRLPRRVATEIVKWARRFNFDPRDVNVYWYNLGAGNICEDGTPVP
jgi:hypothetical protein